MLIDRLKCKSVPSFIVEILQNIFRGSNMSVYWQGVRSKEWHACRGLRQGGILSAIDNSRTGLDTSKNQCSAPAVTALKKIIDGIMSTIYFD